LPDDIAMRTSQAEEKERSRNGDGGENNREQNNQSELALYPRLVHDDYTC
jgi:hypothetical protein